VLTIARREALLVAIAICAACTARPEAEPSQAQLVGTYVLTKAPKECRTPTNASHAVAQVKLAADSSFRIDGLPSCFADDRAPDTRLAGTIAGRWSVSKVEGEYVLELLVQSGPLQHGWNLGVEIRGRTAPFELYFVVGDPDSRTGLVFVRA